MPSKRRPITNLKLSVGMGFWQVQLLLVGIAVAVIGLFSLLQVNTSPAKQFLFTFIIGNCATFTLVLAAPLFSNRKFPWDWLVYLSVLVPVSAVSSSVASMASRIVAGHVEHLFQIVWTDIRVGTFISLVNGTVFYMWARTRGRLLRRNRELESQIMVGQIKLEAHDAELKAAHEIQAHLLPHELPQMAPFQIACAWEPARSVGGDYFDVLTLGPNQLGVCMADVSGKGITAALLMANLQAAVRAFAPGTPAPGALCNKLNQVLCDSIAPERFVTLIYAVLSSDPLTLCFENAGHLPPIVLRGDDATVLTEGGTVLGLFRDAPFGEHQFDLRPGDCLLLTTDGVTEAADEDGEEFGSQRLIASARAVRDQGVQAIRTRILEDVTRFCKGNFHDDASLMVVTVENTGTRS
jgi:phosphoserine phosphatase RsbU/P